MIKKLLQRIKVRRLRRLIRGHRILSKSKSPDIINILKVSLAATDCAESALMSPDIFGAATNNAQVVLRQYLLYHFSFLNLNKAILYTLGKSGSLIVHPMPPQWHVVFEKSGLKVAKFRSTLLWYCYMLLFLAQGFRIIGKTIIQGVKEIIKPAFKDLGRYTYFDALNIINLPKSEDNNKSLDVISWYQQWDGRVHELDSVCHNVPKVNPNDVSSSSVKYLPSTIPPLDTITGLIIFIAWAVKASAISIVDLLRGRWWHVLLLNQAVSAAHVRSMNIDSLACEYMYHNANYIYRHLLTYEVEAKGSLVTFYFYSTNCEGFKRLRGYPKSICGWENINWPRYLVWDDEQSDFVKRSVYEYKSIHIVGSIWFSDSLKAFNPIVEKNVAVFDVTPQRKSLYLTFDENFDFYIPEICNQFVSDIQQVLGKQRHNMLLKKKRKIGALAHPSYELFCENLLLSDNVQSVDADISAVRLIDVCKLVISMPFTSTALIAREMNKPSVYYDPLCILQKDDRAAHGIEILQGKNELEFWVIENI